MSDSIPLDIISDIVRRLARDNVLNIWPFLRAGPTLSSAARCPEVWREASFHEFVSADQYMTHGHKWVPFFRKCIEHGNTSSMLLEGLRRAFNEGDVRSAIPLIRSNGMQDDLDYFMVGMLHILGGDFAAGMQTLNNIYWWMDLERTHVYGTLALTFVYNLNFRRVRAFAATADIPKPLCQCQGADFGMCLCCILQYWATEFVNIS